MPRPYTTFRERYYVRSELEKDTVFALKDLPTRANLELRGVEWPAGDGALAFEQAAGRLLVARHPSLPVVRDAFSEPERAWLVIEPETGVALEPGSYGPEELRHWAAQLLDALDYLHTLEPPVAHGAIAPANLVLRPGNIVALQHYGPHVLVPGDTRSDLHALATTLHQLATGKSVPTVAEREQAVKRGEPDPVSTVAPFGPMLAAALALDPAQRPASARELLTLLEQAPVPASLAAVQTPPEPALTIASVEVVPQLPATPEPPPPAPPVEADDVSPVTPPGTPASSTTPQPPRRSRAWPVAGVVVTLLVLALTLLWPRMVPGNPPVAPVATLAPATSVPSAQQSTPITTTQPEPTVAATTPPQPTASPVPSSTAPLPAVTIARIAPQSVYAGRPFTITVSGTNLGALQTARLLAAEQSPIEVAILAASAGELTLRGEAVATLPAGDTTYQLELDGVPLDEPTLVLRDYIAQAEAKGIVAEYTATGRVRAIAGRLYTVLLAEPRAASAETGVLQSGDAVAVLDDQQPEWYRVRISASVDTAQIGKSGWVQRWLVDGGPPPDNEPPPAAPPAPFVFSGRVVNTATDSAAQCGANFKSTIYGRVLNDTGRPLRNAQISVASADGRNVYPATTNSEGGFSVSGLGCTNWVVRLISLPDPRPVQANPVTVRNLNGGEFTSAEVRFQLQP